MKKLSHLLAAAALLASIHSATAADLTGKITLKGAPLKGPQFDIGGDPGCGNPAGGKVGNTPWYVVDAGGGLADVFVYLKSVTTKSPAPAMPALLDQKNCQYSPYVQGIMVGQTLQVKNSDMAFHNVHPTPAAGTGNQESNKSQLAGAPLINYTFPDQEIFLRFKCDVHGWMFAYVCVLPHPYFAVSKADGTFTIKNVPAGNYTIEAVHRKTHPGGAGVSKNITVSATGGTADFTIDAATQ